MHRLGWGVNAVTYSTFPDEEAGLRETEDLPRVTQLASVRDQTEVGSVLLKTRELRVDRAEKLEGGEMGEEVGVC